MTAGASAESGESSNKAESLSSGISTIVSALDSAALESALSDDDPFAQTGGFRQTLTAIARGEMTIDFQQTADLLSRQFFSAVRQSLWRLTRLIAPALLWALLKQFSGRSSECGRIVVQLFVCVFLTQDLSDHITLAVTTVRQISAGMQGLRPMLLTMMAALETLISSENTDRAARQSAAEELQAYVALHQAQLALEGALLTSELTPCCAVVTDGSVTIVTEKQEITEQDTALVLTLVQVHTGVPASGVRIMTAQ